MMLKILVYAYCCNCYTSCRAAQALDENIHFMWLSAMQRPAILKERNSYMKTDPGATFIRIKGDQLYAGYNIIEGTERHFIVNYSIHQQPGE